MTKMVIEHNCHDCVPFAYLDINSDSRNSYFAKKKHERTIKCKERKKLLKEHKST